MARNWKQGGKAKGNNQPIEDPWWKNNKAHSATQRQENKLRVASRQLATLKLVSLTNLSTIDLAARVITSGGVRIYRL